MAGGGGGGNDLNKVEVARKKEFSGGKVFVGWVITVAPCTQDHFVLL